jgi:hypothetical protein
LNQRSFKDHILAISHKATDDDEGVWVEKKKKTEEAPRKVFHGHDTRKATKPSHFFGV